MRACALRRHRPRAGHGIEHPHDVHVPARPLAEPDPRLGDVGQRLRSAGAALEAHQHLRRRAARRSAPPAAGAIVVLSAGHRAADAATTGAQPRARLPSHVPARRVHVARQDPDHRRGHRSHGRLQHPRRARPVRVHQGLDSQRGRAPRGGLDPCRGCRPDLPLGTGAR